MVGYGENSVFSSVRTHFILEYSGLLTGGFSEMLASRNTLCHVSEGWGAVSQVSHPLVAFYVQGERTGAEPLCNMSAWTKSLAKESGYTPFAVVYTVDSYIKFCRKGAMP